ncbi:MAG: phage tail family protein [Clostridia bacterium]|nr:phage tail family protein [Clostridia bacterium]
MRNGFKFNGHHSSEFDVTVRTKSRPIRPEAKSFTIDLPSRDGEYDFSLSNPQKREHFHDRTFIVTLSLYAENLMKMQNKLMEISKWLTGRGTLIFDDIPSVIWNGKITDEIIYMPEHDGRKAVLEVSFRVQPFGSCIFGTEGPVMDCVEVHLDSTIPIDFDELYTVSAANGQSINIINFGDRPIRPVITITGGASDMTLRMNGKTLDFSAGGDVVVDCEKQTVTNANGSVMVSGEFPELQSGDNVLYVGNSNSDTLNFDISFTPQFMYGADLDNLDWGDNYA